MRHEDWGWDWDWDGVSVGSTGTRRAILKKCSPVRPPRGSLPPYNCLLNSFDTAAFTVVET